MCLFCYITTGKYYWEIDYLDGTYGQYAGITANFDQGAGEIASQTNKSYIGSRYKKTFNASSGSSSPEQGEVQYPLPLMGIIEFLQHTIIIM